MKTAITFGKRSLAVLLALVMCVGMLNLTVFAADVGTGSELQAQILDGTNIVLDKDYTGVALNINNGVTVTLDLNGHTLTGTNGTSVITVNAGGTLTLEDSSGNNAGKITHAAGATGPSYGGGVYVYNGGTFNMSGGKISGNTASSDGGGVYVSSYAGSDKTAGSTLNMSGTAEISGNEAKSGGGVGVNSYGKLFMNGGTISRNGVGGMGSTAGKGAGVYVTNNGTFTMSAGTISGNHADGNENARGGVYVDTAQTGVGNFTMSGGEIIGNTQSQSTDSIVVVGEGKATITGGVFSDDSFKNYADVDYVKGTDGNWYVGKSMDKAPQPKCECGCGKLASECNCTSATCWYECAQGNAYTISTAEELAYLATLVNGGNTFKGATVTLAGDIDLSGYANWMPIGGETYTGDDGKTHYRDFQGTFDGGNHTISNLTITGNKSDVGLFGYTMNGEVKNLTIKNANVSGYLDVGAVAGTPYTTKYNNITLTGTVVINGFSYVGGMFGKNLYASCDGLTIDVDDNSYVKAASTQGTTRYRTYVGGLVGFMGEGNITVSNVTSNIDVYGDVMDIGGITGIAHYGNTFSNVTCTGNVYVNATALTGEIGGIAGVWHNGGSDVMLINCKYEGTISVKVNGEDVVLKDSQSIVGAAYNDLGGASDKGNLIIGDKEAVAVNGNKWYTDLAEAVADAKPDETLRSCTNRLKAF